MKITFFSKIATAAAAAAVARGDYEYDNRFRENGTFRG